MALRKKKIKKSNSFWDDYDDWGGGGWTGWAGGGGYRTGYRSSYRSSYTSQYSVQKATVRAQAFAHTMQRTVRLLGVGRPTVSVITPTTNPEEDRNHMQHAAGWTDQTNIWLNGKVDPTRENLLYGWTNSGLMGAIGVVYHEAAHMMFSPNLQGWLCSTIRDNYDRNHFMILNVIEDQRAESLFVRKWSPSRHYFARFQLEAILDQRTKGDDERKFHEALQYFLICERRFVPIEVREKYKETFYNQNDVEEMQALVAEYKNLRHLNAGDTLAPNDDRRRAVDIVVRLNEILYKDLPEDLMPNDMPNMAGGTAHGEIAEDGSHHPGQTATRMELDNPGGVDRDETLREEEGKYEVDNSTAHKDKKSSHGAGRTINSNKIGRAVEMDVVRRAIREIDDRVAKDLESQKTTMRALELQYRVNVKPQIQKEYPAPQGLIVQANEIERDLKRLRDRFKPGWDHNKPTGKINMNKFTKMMAGDTEVFNRWRSGVHNAASIECVTLLDESGSMDGVCEAVSQINWVLHKAMHEVGAEYTGLGFSSDDEISLVTQRGSKPTKNVQVSFIGGGTAPSAAIQQATNIAMVSKRPIKLCFIVTDGSWSDYPQCDEMIAKSDMYFCVIGLGYRVESLLPERLPQSFAANRIVKCGSIEGAGELAAYMTDVVKFMINRRWG